MALQCRCGRVGTAAILSPPVASIIVTTAMRRRPIRNTLCQRIERHVPNIIIAIQQEPSQNINGQHPQPIIALHRHDRLHALVQNGIPRILAGFRIRGNLRQHVVHLLGRLDVVRAQQSQQREDLHLQERVGDSPHVVIGRVAHAEQIPQQFDQGGDQAQEGRAARTVGVGIIVVTLPIDIGLIVILPVHDQYPRHELHHRNQHPVAPIVQQRNNPIHEILHHIRTLCQTPRHGQTRLLPQIRLGIPQVLVHLGCQIPAHVGSGQIANGAQCQSGNEFIVAV
mmetsp:Transcript_16811/g.36284  ORF Transcript_16811/g.36284 Transcript_16811/m.36284 type:complete len:282 (+) Transcript_16811:2108-2953(+)